MRRWMGMPIAATLALSACVTINVYFPAAEAKEAAKEFVDQVIGDAVPAPAPAGTPAPTPAPGGGMALLDANAPARIATWVSDARAGFDPWLLLGVGTAQAQSAPDITIKTPAIQAIQSRMAGRFDGVLGKQFSAGALGFSNDGLVEVRDASLIALGDRVAVNQAVADQNRDAKAVYREVAVANNHPEWEAQIRKVFAAQWIASARSGWWYQDGGGAWKQK